MLVSPLLGVRRSLRKGACEWQGSDKQLTEDAFHGALIARLMEPGSGCCL
jgi:hypothetical protein